MSDELRILWGTETEYLLYERPDRGSSGPETLVAAGASAAAEFPSDDRDVLLANWLGAPPEWRRLSVSELVEVLRLVPAEAGLADGKALLFDGSYFYVDPPALEFSTRVCKTVREVLVSEQFGHDLLVEHVLAEYHRRTSKRVVALRHVFTEEGAGYHENYGLQHRHYFRLFGESNFYPLPIVTRVLIPFLVTRPMFAGAGEFFADEGSVRGWRMTLSQRSRTISEVFSVDARRGILNLRRPNIDEPMLRLHITCGDPLAGEFSKKLQLGSTALTLLACAEGRCAHLDFTLQDPVHALHTLCDLSGDGLHDVKLADGSDVSAVEIQRAILDAAESTPGWD